MRVCSLRIQCDAVRGGAHISFENSTVRFGAVVQREGYGLYVEPSPLLTQLAKLSFKHSIGRSRS